MFVSTVFRAHRRESKNLSYCNPDFNNASLCMDVGSSFSIPQKKSLPLRWGASLLPGYCWEGLDIHCLCLHLPTGGKICLMSSVPPQELDFPEDPTWDDLGSHLVCTDIQKTWVAPSLSVGGHCRTQLLRRKKGSCQYIRKWTDLGQDATWVAFSINLQCQN